MGGIGGHQALVLKHSFNWNGNNRPRLLQLNISPSENKKLSKNIIASSYQIYLHAAKDLFCQRTHISYQGSTQYICVKEYIFTPHDSDCVEVDMYVMLEFL